MRYKITWEVELEADNPLEAAYNAWDLMVDGDGCAPEFFIEENEENHDELYRVNLENKDLVIKLNKMI